MLKLNFECLREECKFILYIVPGPSCGAGDFKCEDGSCIPGNWECDAISDCADGSDEVNCITTLTTSTTTTTSTTRGIIALASITDC